MTFEQHCIIPVRRAELWSFLLDIPQMALCVPGAEDVLAESDDRYRGRLRIKIGPIRLTLEGAMVIEERDREQWRAVARSEAKDRRVGGGARVSGEMRLVDNGPSATELILSGQVRFLGKLGEFGEPLIRKQADLLVAAFAQNVAAHFASTAANDQTQPEHVSPERSPVPCPPTAPERQPSMSMRNPGQFPWAGALAGLTVGILAIAASSRSVSSSWLPQRLKSAAGSSLWRWPLRIIAPGGLTWIGVKALLSVMKDPREGGQIKHDRAAPGVHKYEEGTSDTGG